MSTKTIKFSVPDMHCESCPKLINITLEEIPGVVSSNASLKDKTVIVAHTEKVSPELLISAIEETGYNATITK